MESFFYCIFVKLYQVYPHKILSKNSIFKYALTYFFFRNKRFIGKVKLSHIDAKSKAKRVFVATESNVVACLSSKTGKLLC